MRILSPIAFTAITFFTVVSLGQTSPSCPVDLSKAAVVMLSGGPIDGTNPPEVRSRMDLFLTSINNDPRILACTGGKGIQFKMLSNQKHPHIHQSHWAEVCAALIKMDADPIVLAGHSNGGAAIVNVSRCLQASNKNVELLLTIDTVKITNALGDYYKIPDNVKLNVNMYSVKGPKFDKIPFWIGHANTRETGAPLRSLVNVGFHYNLPGAIEHKNTFYEFAGGPLRADGFAKPFTLLDLTLAALTGATEHDLTTLLETNMNKLSQSSNIPIDFQSNDLQETISPKAP